MSRIKSEKRALFERLFVFKEDFVQARYFAKHLLKKGWHFEHWEKQWTTYMQQAAYTSALVTAYGRPFAHSRRHPTLSMKLAPFSAKQKVLHEKLMTLRNEVYAHSEVSKQNVRPLKIGKRATAVIHSPSLKLTKEEAEAVLQMTQIIVQSIERELEQLIDSIYVETEPA